MVLSASSRHVPSFDFKAVFDKVDHHLLFLKMTNAGIHGKTVGCSQNYLSGRTFQVIVADSLSGPRPALSGVPQEVSLLPLLFVIYVPDLKAFIPRPVKYLSFADDLKIFGPVLTEDDRHLLQSTIDGIVDWCRLDRMSLSPAKCSVLAAEHSGPIWPEYHNPGTSLPVVRSLRDLGVTISVDLDFSGFVTDTAKAARILVYCISRCFLLKTPEFYIRLYNSLVVLRFLYCCPVWLPFRKKHFCMLKSVRTYFLKRLHLRCNFPAGAVVLPSIQSSLSDQDLRVLKRLIDLGLSDHFFDVRRNNLRSQATVLPKSLARADLIANMFSWRICSEVANRQMSSQTF